MQSRLPSALLRASRSALSILGRGALQIVLPSWCAACDRELPWRDRTASCCAPCWESLPRIAAAKCRSCALPVPGLEVPSFLCIDCRTNPLPVGWCDAWGEYRGRLARLLHALKFERHDFLDDALASLLEETLRARGDLAFAAIAAIPMTRARERRRGYNQAELLGRALSARIGVPYESSLRRTPGPRAMQSTLPKKERAANVRGAFVAEGVAGKAVLLVDDICTTGETLRTAAGALLDGGASRVCAITVAKAV